MYAATKKASFATAAAAIASGTSSGSGGGSKRKSPSSATASATASASSLSASAIEDRLMEVEAQIETAINDVCHRGLGNPPIGSKKNLPSGDEFIKGLRDDDNDDNDDNDDDY